MLNSFKTSFFFLFFCECFKNLWDFLFLISHCFFMFLFTSLSKVHLKVEYRDRHTPVLFCAISNMLASLKNATDRYFPTLFKSLTS